MRSIRRSLPKALRIGLQDLCGHASEVGGAEKPRTLQADQLFDLVVAANAMRHVCARRRRCHYFCERGGRGGALSRSSSVSAAVACGAGFEAARPPVSGTSLACSGSFVLSGDDLRRDGAQQSALSRAGSEEGGARWCSVQGRASRDRRRFRAERSPAGQLCVAKA